MQMTLNNLLVAKKFGHEVIKKPKKEQMVESFHEFCNKVLPQMEEQVETNILRSLYNSTENKLIRKEILNSFRRRKLDIHYKAIGKKNTFVKSPPIPEEDEFEPNPFLYDFGEMTLEYVGHPFEIFSKQAFSWFSTGFFGHKEYLPKFYYQAERFAFMFTLEMFKVVKILERLHKSNEFLFAGSDNSHMGQYYLIPVSKPCAEVQSQQSNPFRSFQILSRFDGQDQERLLEQISSQKDLDYLFQNYELFLNLSNLLRDSFRRIVVEECNRWVQLPKIERMRRFLEKKPEKFYNLMLDGPENIYSNYLKSLDLDELTGETLYEKIREGEQRAIARDKANAELVARVSGQTPKNEILIDETVQEEPVDETDWSHLAWDDPDMPFHERDRRNAEVELLNRIFGECFLFDAIVSFLVWHLHVPKVRERLLDGAKRRRMFESLMEQIKTHEKREFISPQKPEVYFQIMGALDLGGYMLDCSFYDPNLDENLFRQHYVERFGLATPLEAERLEAVDFAKKHKNYVGFDTRISKSDMDTLSTSPFKHLNVPNYGLFFELSQKKYSADKEKEQLYIIKKYKEKDQLEILPKKKKKKKEKAPMRGSIKDMDKQFYQEDQMAPRLNYSLEEVQSLHRRTPPKLDEISIHNFSGHQSGVLMWGDHGVGKSGTLMGLAAWGYHNDWFVLKLPSVFSLTQESFHPKEIFQVVKNEIKTALERWEKSKLILGMRNRVCTCTLSLSKRF